MHFSPLTLCLLFSTLNVVTAVPVKPENSDSDRSPGIGVEFEAVEFVFSNEECAEQDTFDSKGKEVDGRSGKDWALTVDTSNARKGKLSSEYILDGKSIKLGSGRAKEAAAELKEDLDNWKPWEASKDCPSTIDLLKPINDKCEAWSIEKPTKEIGFKFLQWQRQVTAPMPLPAINELFRSAKTSLSSPLMPEHARMTSRMVWVNEHFFQSAPECNNGNEVGDNVLAFFSLVLSYAKSGNSASGRDEEKSLKMASSIMPRSDFLTIYNDVKSGIQGGLYELVRVLLCYKNSQEGDGAEFDSTWCDGSPEAPEPNTNMDLLTYKIKGTNPHTKKTETLSFTLQDWMEGLNGKGKKLEEANRADGTTGAQDLMAYYDRWIDGQIGGLKGVKEHIYDNDKAQVPLFEFRDLGGSSSDKFQQEVEKAENEVLKYHRKYHNGKASGGSG